MSGKNTYIDLLRAHSSDLQNQFGISSMSIFGSVARGEDNKDSDVDLFVQMPPTLRAIGGAQIYLENLMHKKVDIVRDSQFLTPVFRKQIERDGISIF